MAPNPNPNPNGSSSVSESLFIKYVQIVRLEASNKIGPIDDAPKIAPIPPSSIKSPAPIPSRDLRILYSKFTENNKP